MNTILLMLAAFTLLLILLIGLYRAFRQGILAERMLSVQLIGTTGIAFLLISSQTMQASALIDVALIIALLAAVSLVALTAKENKHE